VNETAIFGIGVFVTLLFLIGIFYTVKEFQEMYSKGKQEPKSRNPISVDQKKTD